MNIFDVIGPIMIGPSSSHTAGAVRLANLARTVLGEPVGRAVIGLHGSFAQTYAGHGTDVALIAGLQNWRPDDKRIPDSFKYAKESGLDICFEIIDLGEGAHPNSVRFHLTGIDGNKVQIIGSSVGAGRIVVTEIDGFQLELFGELPTLIVTHLDRPGAIAQVTQILYRQGVNIARMKVSRKKRGAAALMVLETDEEIEDVVLNDLTAVADVNGIRKLAAIT
jgi:L-serine dehydratase